ncbi:hypothetical protein EV207_1294 [Scopulibacillus darangshiensis]|uniref:Lipoprotein n=1 Tax=Scopulibacillus darangshiensis TaxID=442528 RepID=A0A4R2NPQ2_9BACL|nr:hypothetical protein [Scopulibacillus darangshiensis]TCP23727.1 hypothetical protein EV207_1294 [Scopulibacillus darangshiensis]
MKRSRITILLFSIISIVLLLTACNSEIEEEFNKYNTKDRINLYNKSLKLKELQNEYISLMAQPKKAHDYLTEKVIPFVEDIYKQDKEIQKKLKTEEVKDLNAISLKQFRLTLDMLKKQDDILKLRIPPVSKEEHAKALKIYEKVQKLSDDIQQTGDEYEKRRVEMAKKYESK